MKSIIDRLIVLLLSLFSYKQNKVSQIRHKCVDVHLKSVYYGYIKLPSY